MMSTEGVAETHSEWNCGGNAGKVGIIQARECIRSTSVLVAV
jgi:hypothetical protein